MKTGKNISLKLFGEVKTVYGTVNSKSFKSLYLKMETWVSPTQEQSNWKYVIGKFDRTIRHIINQHLDKVLFKKQFIVDLDLRGSGIHVGKKSFMSLEIILYPQDGTDFHSDEIRESVEFLMQKIYIEGFKNGNKFSLFKTKKSIA